MQANSVQSRDAIGIAALALLVIIFRIVFLPAPVSLPPPQELVTERRVWEAEGNRMRPEPEQAREERERGYSERESLFMFDPNTLDSIGFRKLGFSAAQTLSLLRYRASGATFRKPEDFSRAYVVSEQVYLRLLPYIQIQTNPQIEKALPNRARVSPDSLEVAPSQAVRRPQWETIEINGADSLQLIKLRGIGPYYAQKIMRYRERLGGFVAAEQLMEIEGIDEERFALMGPQIETDLNLVRKIDLITADQSSLGRHPYIGPYAARWIVHYREQWGDTVCTLPSLLRRNIIKPEQAVWLEHYVE